MVGAGAENWPGFRGEGARGVAKTTVPVRWDVKTGENVAWKVAVPGLGHSSPVIWGDQIFLTTAVSSDPKAVFERKLIGQLDKRQDQARQEFRVMAIDRKSGKIFWSRAAVEMAPRVLRHPHNSYASPTPATDGKRLVAFFGSEGLYCYGLDGKLLWKKDLGVMDQGAFDVPDYQWGSAASPLLWRGKVYLQVDLHKDSYLAAFDAASGKELWRVKRDSKPSWSTPTVYEGKGHAELIANGVETVMGYDPTTGEELWRLKGTSMISVPTPFVSGDLIYVFSGYYRNMKRAYAIRPGARGDITGSKEALAWTSDDAPYLSTPVIAGGVLYHAATRGGILSAMDARTGAVHYQQRLGEGTPVSASLVAAGDIVYVINEDGAAYALRAGPRFEQLGVNQMDETVMATPAISGGRLYVRGERHLFAIGK